MPTSKTLNPGHRLPSLRLRAGKAACSAVLIAVGTLLSGCQGIVNSPTASQVRIIAASPDAPGLDIYQNNVAIAYNLGFGTITSYVPIDPGTYTTAATSSGTKQVLSSNKATFVTATQYTVLIGNVAASLQQLTLKDQSQPAPSGQIALRFIDQATRVNGLDAYLVPAGKKLTDVTPVTTDLTFNVNTGYLNIPTGTYTLVLVPTGTVPTSTTIATYTGPQVTYSQGSATTIILIDQQLVTTPGLQVLSAPDYVSPTATS
ncbi:MAG TPA: DUF4397 domain-containing protein [Edaphobacter sp.]